MYANGFTMWHYKSADSVDDVLAAGYFDPASDMLRVGDFLFANLEFDDAGQNGLLVVAYNNTGSINVSPPGLLSKQDQEPHTLLPSLSDVS